MLKMATQSMVSGDGVANGESWENQRGQAGSAVGVGGVRGSLMGLGVQTGSVEGLEGGLEGSGGQAESAEETLGGLKGVWWDQKGSLIP